MKKMNQWLTTAIAAAAICFGASNLLAQNNGNNNGSNNNNNGNNNGGNGGNGGRRNRGNFDPAQFQQRMMDNLKEQLEITDDAEWKAIEPMVQKVLTLTRETSGGMGRMFRGGRGGGGGGGDTSQSDSNRPRGGGFFGPPSAETEALQKAIDGKASNAEMKAAIAKYQEAHQAKMAELEKAQADLRKVLSVRQEAVATLDGLL
jgi:hypothetical protein